MRTLIPLDRSESRKRRKGGGNAHAGAAFPLHRWRFAIERSAEWTSLPVRSILSMSFVLSDFAAVNGAALCAASVAVRAADSSSEGRIWGVRRPPLPPPDHGPARSFRVAHAPNASLRRPAEPRSVRDTAKCAACVLADTRIDFIDENTACQVFAGNRVHIGERALALNAELRRTMFAASCLSFISAPRSPCKFADVRHGRVSRGHHDAKLSGGPRLGQATPLRSVRFAAHGLDRTAVPPGTRNYVMASRMTVALTR
jgi:hypothetical protein